MTIRCLLFTILVFGIIDFSNADEKKVESVTLAISSSKGIKKIILPTNTAILVNKILSKKPDESADGMYELDGLYGIRFKGKIYILEKDTIIYVSRKFSAQWKHKGIKKKILDSIKDKNL